MNHIGLRGTGAARIRILAALYIALSDATFKISFPDGHTEKTVMKAGEAHWREPVMHAAEKVGNTEAHALAMELKKP